MSEHTLREKVARAIYAKRPDCQGKPWPIVTAEDARAYPHNPIAAVDLSLVYADAAIAIVLEEAAKVAKVAWLTCPYGSLSDAGAMSAVCEHAENAIRALNAKS